jgi:hypothetical protein
MATPSWRNDLINHIQKLRVFRTREIVEFGISNGVSKRSIDSEIKNLALAGLLIPASRGIYCTSEIANNPRQALIEIGNCFQPGGAACLDTGLFDQSDVVHIAVPSGKIGSFATPLGQVNIHAMTSALTTRFLDKYSVSDIYNVAPDEVRNGAVYSPEISLICAGYLTGCGRSDYYPAGEINSDVLSSMRQPLLSNLIMESGVQVEHINNILKPGLDIGKYSNQPTRSLEIDQDSPSP